MTFDEFKEKLDEWDWDDDQKDFLERYSVAAGISASQCGGTNSTRRRPTTGW